MGLSSHSRLQCFAINAYTEGEVTMMLRHGLRTAVSTCKPGLTFVLTWPRREYGVFNMFSSLATNVLDILSASHW